MINIKPEFAPGYNFEENLKLAIAAIEYFSNGYPDLINFVIESDNPNKTNDITVFLNEDVDYLQQEIEDSLELFESKGIKVEFKITD